MSYMFEYSSVKSAAVLPPKPEPKAPVGFTMEQLKADAKAMQARQRKTWGVTVVAHRQTESKPGQTFWTYERNTELGAVIAESLRQHGGQSTDELFARLFRQCSRDKLRKMLGDMHKQGMVTKQRVGAKRHEWSLA